MTDLSLEPIRTSDWNAAAARHLLRRAGFGGPPEQVQALAAMKPASAVELLLDYERTPTVEIPDSTFDKDIRRPPTAEEREVIQRARRGQDEALQQQLQQMRNEKDREDREQLREIQQWWLQRMIETGRPMQERMTLFWHGHFATGYRGVENSYHMFLQNQMLRQHATGNFADLVMRILRDPAMLKYLDNDESRKGRPNENLARELMELFVLGEGNGYTEDDIKEGARALTGYTFDDDTFAFETNRHDDGPKTIFGSTGNWNGDDFARIILSRKEPSLYICAKLYRALVNDAPGMPGRNEMRVVDALAKKMREGQYDLKPVLRTLLLSRHFYDPANRASMIKSPVQLVVGATRELGVPVRNMSTVNAATDLMGQSLFMPPSVKGWDGGQLWINTSTLFVRQNLLVYLITGAGPDGGADLGSWDPAPIRAALDSATAGDASRDADALLDLVLACDATPERRKQFRSAMEALGGPLEGRRLVRALCLVTALPEYQLC